jgi:protein-glutamine gamma-glutamyltransferase
MTFAQYFKASSYCWIGSGFLAIAATGYLDTISIILFSIVFISSGFLNAARFQRRIPLWALNVYSVACLSFFVFDYRLLSGSFLIAILHLLFLVAAVKLLTLSKDRDYLHLYLISFAELLAASILTVSVAFIFCFLIFLFSGTGTLILFEMRRSNARVRSESHVQPLVTPVKPQENGLELFSPFPAGLVSTMVIGITLLILGGAIPLFVLLPRVTWGFNPRPSGSTQFISGFSDLVELGQIGNIKLSDAIVMRVKTDKTPSELPPNLKWRGLALDHYDGKVWKRSDTSRQDIPIQGWFYKLENSAHDTNWISQTFFIEALSTDVVFAASKTLAISRDVGSLQRDWAGSLYTTRHPQRKLRYIAVSDPIRPDPANITDLTPIPPDIPSLYLQLPPLDPRIADLTRQITKPVRGRYAQAQAIERYLRSHYSYGLQLRGTPNSPDPLAMFLFDIREGHCEYFASAMTVMLRQTGIPARLVNGFHIGEYNSIGRNWIVRGYNAHSWVEAYFPPYGWVEFDPTPIEPQRSKSAFINLISHLTDALDLWWWEGIVNYSFLKQNHVINGLYSRIDALQSSAENFAALAYHKIRNQISQLFSPDFASKFTAKWAFWIPGLILILFWVIRPVRRRLGGLVKRKFYQNRPRIIAASFYAEALSLLGSQGFHRSQDQTFWEFAQSLGSHPAGIPFLALTQMYNAVRFGPPEAQFPCSEAQSLLRSLRASLPAYGPKQRVAS